MFKKIRELSRGLNSYLKNLGKEPEKKAEEVKEQRKKLKKGLMTGVTLTAEGSYVGRVRKFGTDFYLGSWERQAAAEIAVMEFRSILRNEYVEGKTRFFRNEHKLRGLAVKFRECAKGGSVFRNAIEYMGFVDPWDANTPS